MLGESGSRGLVCAFAKIQCSHTWEKRSTAVCVCVRARYFRPAARQLLSLQVRRTGKLGRQANCLKCYSLPKVPHTQKKKTCHVVARMVAASRRAFGPICFRHPNAHIH